MQLQIQTYIQILTLFKYGLCSNLWKLRKLEQPNLKGETRITSSPGGILTSSFSFVAELMPQSS